MGSVLGRELKAEHILCWGRLHISLPIAWAINFSHAWIPFKIEVLFFWSISEWFTSEFAISPYGSQLCTALKGCYLRLLNLSTFSMTLLLMPLWGVSDIQNEPQLHETPVPNALVLPVGPECWQEQSRLGETKLGGCCYMTCNPNEQQ